MPEWVRQTHRRRAEKRDPGAQHPNRWLSFHGRHRGGQSERFQARWQLQGLTGESSGIPVVLLCDLPVENLKRFWLNLTFKG